MALCRKIIGQWIPHPCGGRIVNGLCARCGAPEGTPPGGSALIDHEYDFSAEELERFSVILTHRDPSANPPEWGVDPFRDFT